MTAIRSHVKHTRASVTRRAQAEYDALDRIVRRLRPADFDRYVFDERARIRWTVKDVIAHLTAWKLRDVRRITGYRGPLRPYDAPYGAGSHEPNARIYERSHRTPAKTIVAEHRSAHRATLKALRAAPSDVFAKHYSAVWPADRLARGMTHKAIASELRISINTVANLAANAYKKLGAHGAAAAVLAHRDAHPWCGSRIDFGPILERIKTSRTA